MNAGSAALGGISAPINVFNFEDKTLERPGLLQQNKSKNVPPFLVVASNDLNQVSFCCLAATLACLLACYPLFHLLPHALVRDLGLWSAVRFRSSWIAP